MVDKKKFDDGGLVFPCSVDDYGYRLSGMSVRDYFAAVLFPAAALQPDAAPGDPETTTQAVAQACYAFADAMIAEKRRREGGDDA
jgi:hypothetical protein